MLEPLKAFLTKLFKIEEKPRKAKYSARALRLNPQHYTNREFEAMTLKVRGINAARKLEELKEARKA